VPTILTSSGVSSAANEALRTPKWMKTGKNGYSIRNIIITPEILKLTAGIDEFKGRWKVIETLAPEKLTSLRRVATIESVGSSTRMEGGKLSDAEVEKLLSGLRSETFASRDEQEVAGYAAKGCT
jgi:hypothetical protein